MTFRGACTLLSRLARFLLFHTCRANCLAIPRKEGIQVAELLRNLTLLVSWGKKTMGFGTDQEWCGSVCFLMCSLWLGSKWHACFFKQLTYRETVTFADTLNLSYFHGLQRSYENTDCTLLVPTIYTMSVPRQPWDQVSEVRQKQTKPTCIIPADLRRVAILKWINQSLQADL